MKQALTCDLSLQLVEESDGRDLVCINTGGFDSGHYDMFLLRFKSKIIAANFRMAFICAVEVSMLAQRSETVDASVAGDVAPSTADQAAADGAFLSNMPSASSSSTFVVKETSRPKAVSESQANRARRLQGPRTK